MPPDEAAMTETLVKGVTQTLDTALKMAIDLLPKILGMLIIIAIGWVIAMVLKIVFRHFLRLVKFNTLCENVGATQMFTKDRKSTRLNSSHQLISYAVF